MSNLFLTSSLSTLWCLSWRTFPMPAFAWRNLGGWFWFLSNHLEEGRSSKVALPYEYRITKWCTTFCNHVYYMLWFVTKRLLYGKVNIMIRQFLRMSFKEESVEFDLWTTWIKSRCLLRCLVAEGLLSWVFGTPKLLSCPQQSMRTNCSRTSAKCL